MKRLDWAGARVRLESVQQALERSEAVPRERMLRIFEERAEILARAKPRVDGESGDDMLLVFRLGAERYAVPVPRVGEVLPKSKLAPLPGAPANVAGVVQIRGEIRPVYDLRRQLGLAANGQARPAGEVVMIDSGRDSFGFRVDAVEEIRRAGGEDQRGRSTLPQGAWVTADLVTVLNVEMLRTKEQ